MMLYDPSLLTKLLVSLAILALALLVTRTARRVAEARFDEPATRKQAWITIRNIALLSSLVLLGLTWTLGGDQSSLPLAAVAGATLIVSKDILISAMGGAVLFLTRTYQVGDFVEVGGVRGRVADIRFLSTLLDGSGDADLITGSRVLLQHSVILTGLLKVTPHEHYMLTTVRVFVGEPQDIPARQALLQDAANEVCAAWIDEADRALLALEATHWSRLPSARPRVFIDLSSDKGAQLVGAFPCRVEERLQVEQQVLGRFVEALAVARAGAPETGASGTQTSGAIARSSTSEAHEGAGDSRPMPLASSAPMHALSRTGRKD